MWCRSVLVCLDRPLSSGSRCSTTSAQRYALMTRSLKRSADRRSAGFNRVTRITEPTSTNPLLTKTTTTTTNDNNNVEWHVLTAMARVFCAPQRRRFNECGLKPYIRISWKPNVHPRTRSFESATILLCNTILCCPCRVCVCVCVSVCVSVQFSERVLPATSGCAAVGSCRPGR